MSDNVALVDMTRVNWIWSAGRSQSYPGVHKDFAGFCSHLIDQPDLIALERLARAQDREATAAGLPDQHPVEGTAMVGG